MTAGLRGSLPGSAWFLHGSRTDSLPHPADDPVRNRNDDPPETQTRPGGSSGRSRCETVFLPPGPPAPRLSFSYGMHPMSENLFGRGNAGGPEAGAYPGMESSTSSRAAKNASTFSGRVAQLVARRTAVCDSSTLDQKLMRTFFCSCSSAGLDSTRNC